jgi:hypothetical protein
MWLLSLSRDIGLDMPARRVSRLGFFSCRSATGLLGEEKEQPEPKRSPIPPESDTDDDQNLKALEPKALDALREEWREAIAVDVGIVCPPPTFEEFVAFERWAEDRRRERHPKLIEALKEIAPQKLAAIREQWTHCRAAGDFRAEGCTFPEFVAFVLVEEDTEPGEKDVEALRVMMRAADAQYAADQEIFNLSDEERRRRLAAVLPEAAGPASRRPPQPH